MHDFPLGISRDNGRVNFAFNTQGIDECTLLIYDIDGKRPEYEFKLGHGNCRGSVFSVQVDEEYVLNRAYMYDVKGRLVMDPYAPGVVGREQFGIRSSRSCRGFVSFDDFDWIGDKKLCHTYAELIMYKLHVRGFTMSEGSGVRHKGTFAGITEKLPYLTRLGINALVLMPCYEFDEIIEADSRYVNNENNTGINYWGYGANCQYFAPKASYAADTGRAAYEFKSMIKECHKRGIEVIMEFCFSETTDILMIDECLRYWVNNYHIDGFRFVSEVKYIDVLANDPYLKDTKLISYGWDANISNKDEYGISAKNSNLAECNDAFMFTARRFLKGDEGQVSGFRDAFRYSPESQARINYITDNNGFTLADLYSYDIKHNDINGEAGRDGTDYNYSWNCGCEGATRKTNIRELRTMMIKNAFAMLLLSRGTPLLLAGDEFCNSQEGNNNAYCQDNNISWLDWNKRKQSVEITDFVRKLIKLRKENSVFTNTDKAVKSGGIYKGCPEISFHGTKAWYPDYANYSRTLGIMLAQDNEQEAYYYLIFNMHWEEHSFDLPVAHRDVKWERVFTTIKTGDSNKPVAEAQSAIVDKQFVAPPRTITIIKAIKETAGLETK